MWYSPGRSFAANAHSARAVSTAGIGQRNSSVKSLTVRLVCQARRISSLKARSPVGDTPPFKDVRITVCLGFASTIRSAATLVSA